MPHTKTPVALSLVALSLLLASCAAPAQWQAATTVQEVEQGVQYIHEYVPEVPWSIHVAKVQRSRKDLRLAAALAELRIYGLSPLSRTVRWAEKAMKVHAVVAVNGDFFNLEPGNYQGALCGIQIVEGELVSAPVSQPAFWVDAQGEPRIGRVASKLRVVWPDGRTETPIRLNQERRDDAAVLYTPTMGLSPSDEHPVLATTRTTGGREIVLEAGGKGPWLPLAVGRTYEARVRAVRDGGNTPLAQDAMVLSLSPQLADKAPVVKAGDVLKLVIETEPDLSGGRTAIGGGNVLVSGGKMSDLGGPSQPRHPRTVVGWNDECYFLFVVDGRQAGLSIGMTYRELGALALRYGCTEALELDGGGSSTMLVAGQVVNSPSDGEQRPIANALMVVRKTLLGL